MAVLVSIVRPQIHAASLPLIDAVEVTTYTRAAASDYDDWESVYGNKGWGSKDLIPLLKKVRACTFSGDIILSNEDRPKHTKAKRSTTPMVLQARSRYHLPMGMPTSARSF